MEEKDFVTINGAHVPIKKNGDITGKIAKKIKETQSEKTQLTDTTPKVNEFQKALEACQGDHYKAAQKFIQDDPKFF